MQVDFFNSPAICPRPSVDTRSTLGGKPAPRRTNSAIEPPILPAQPAEPMMSPPFPEGELPTLTAEGADYPSVPTVGDNDEEYNAVTACDDTTIAAQLVGRWKISGPPLYEVVS